MLEQAGSFKGMADMMSPGTLLGMGIAEAIKGAASRQLETRFSNSKFGKDRIYDIKSYLPIQKEYLKTWRKIVIVKKY